MAPVIIQKTRNATSPIHPKSDRAESITGGLSTKTGDISSTSDGASKGGYISKQGPVGRGSRPAAQLQPANEETLATLSKSSRPCRNRHSSKWSKTRVPHDPAAQEQQPSSSTSVLPYHRFNPDPYPVHSGLAGKGYNHHQKHSHPGVLEPIVPCAKGRRQKETRPRPLSTEFVHKNPRPKNGAPGEDPAKCVATNVGNEPGHSRCLPGSLDCQSLPKILLFQLQRPNLHVPTHAVWLDNSALGLFKTNETGEIISETLGCNYKFIHRRFSKSRHHQRFSHTAQFLDEVSIDMARFRHQQEEIPTKSVSNHRISRCDDKFQRIDSCSSPEESRKNPFFISPVDRVSYDHTTTTRIVGRAINVCTQVDAAGQVTHKQSHSLAEPLHQSAFQGCSGPCKHRSNPSSCSVPKPVAPVIPPVLPPHKAIPDHHDGRLRWGLVGGNSTLQGQRHVDLLGTYKLHKCPRIVSNVQCGRFFQRFPAEHTSQNTFRQYGYVILSKENGFISISKNEQCVQGFSFIVSQIQHSVCCGPHCGSSECSCRQGLTSGDDQYREHVGPRFLTIHMGQMEVKPMARRLRYVGYYEMSFVCLSVPGSKSLRHRCMSARLERMDISGKEHLFLPSTCVNALLGREVCDFQRPWRFDCSIQWSHLASTPNESSRQGMSTPKELLPLPIYKGKNSHAQKELWETGCFPLKAQGLAQVSAPIPTTSNGVSTQQSPAPIPSQQLKVSIPVVRTGDPDLSRLEVCFNEFIKLGYSPEAAYVISNSHKASTKNQNQSGWKLWLAYLKSNNISNEQVNAITLCNFLVFQGVQISRALSTLKVYYYSIRKPFKLLYNTDLPPKDDLDDLFNGIYHINPPPTKEELAPKWDLTSLLAYLRGEKFEPLKSVSSNMVEIKAFILILIATGRRVGEISSATFDNVKFIGDDKVELGWSPTFRAKAQRSKSSWSPANPSFSALIGASDDLLCPVRAFRAYYEIRCKFAHDACGGYLWTRKLKQISNLVRDTILVALKQFQPDLLEVPNLLVRVHQLRKFAISLAKKYLKVSDDELCKLVGSRTIAVPYRKYISAVSEVKLPCQIPGGTLYPSNAPH